MRKHPRVDCKAKLSGVINFVNGSLRPIRSDVDERLSAWYKDNSLVYVAGEHAIWTDPKLQSKIKKKRFGTVIKSDHLTLNGMMKAHAEEVQTWIAARSIDAAGQTGDTTEDDKMV